MVVILTLIGCNSSQTNFDHSASSDAELPEILTLGFCPTMRNDAQDFQKQNERIELMPFGSAGEVLAQLKSGQIDFALIGRKAEKYEINAQITEQKMFETGFTLIAPKKSFITKKDLATLEIKTCLEKEDTRIHPSYFTDLTNIVFVKHPKCKTDREGVWFIPWYEWTDEMALLIPVDETGNKIKKYRSPFLYGENFNNLNF